MPPKAAHDGIPQPSILLTSVFGPYAQDDEYGSRVRNPMELYHNQVTRVQGPFSLRLFHRSWGLMLIQANVNAPCTLLDFPSLERFVEEICDRHYDIVGISGILPNLLKVKKMCELVRRHLPQAEIVVGGHIANIPDLARRIDADHVVRGEGVRWFRTRLGEDRRDPQGLAPRVRLEVAVAQCRGRPLCVLEDALRREATRQGLDLRAADVLRTERSRTGVGLD